MTGEREFGSIIFGQPVNHPFMTGVTVPAVASLHTICPLLPYAPAP